VFESADKEGAAWAVANSSELQSNIRRVLIFMISISIVGQCGRTTCRPACEQNAGNHENFKSKVKNVGSAARTLRPKLKGRSEGDAAMRHQIRFQKRAWFTPFNCC
jgi:hypothetical protein